MKILIKPNFFSISLTIIILFVYYYFNNVCATEGLGCHIIPLSYYVVNLFSDMWSVWDYTILIFEPLAWFLVYIFMSLLISLIRNYK